MVSRNLEKNAKSETPVTGLLKDDERIHRAHYQVFGSVILFLFVDDFKLANHALIT